MRIIEAAVELVRVRRLLIEKKKERRAALDEAGITRETHGCWRDIGHDDDSVAWCEACARFKPMFEVVTELTARRSQLTRNLDRAVLANDPKELAIELRFSGQAAGVLRGMERTGLYGADIHEVCQRLVERVLQEKFELQLEEISKTAPREAAKC